MNQFPMLIGSMAAIAAVLAITVIVAATGPAVRKGALGALSCGLGLALFLAFGAGLMPGGACLAWEQETSGEASSAEGSQEKTTPAADASPAAEGAKQLAEAPEDPVIAPRVVIPAGRPEWVEQSPVRSGDRHSQSVCSEPYRDLPAAQIALNEKLATSVQDYIAEQLESRMAGTLIHYDLATINRRFVKSRYEEAIEVSSLNVPMQQIHAQLEFDQDFRREIAQRWQKVQAAGRLGKIAVVSVGVLMLLSAVFGYFRVDNATRGYHTGRLQLITAAAILALVAAGVVFARTETSDWMHAAANWEQFVSTHDCSAQHRCSAH